MQDQSSKALLEFLGLTKTELIIFPVLGALLILVARTASFFHSITSSIGADDKISRFWNSLTGKLSNYSDVSGAFLWFLVGAIAYLVIWMLVVVAIDWYNDVLVSTSFVHPNSFHQSDYWFAHVGRFLIRVSSLILLGVLAVITLGTFVKSGYDTALSAWSSGSAGNMTWNFIKIMVVTIVVLYSATLLLRLLFLKKRLLDS